VEKSAKFTSTPDVLGSAADLLPRAAGALPPASTSDGGNFQRLRGHVVNVRLDRIQQSIKFLRVETTPTPTMSGRRSMVFPFLR
jgi:hypothetical protein